MYQSKLGRKNQDMDVSLRFSESEERSIGEVLQYCFRSLAAGIDCKANFSVLSPEIALQLVQVAVDHELYHPVRVDASADVWQYFLGQLSQLAGALKTVSADLNKRDDVWADELLQTAAEHPDYLRMCNIYQIIKSEWRYLENLSITYRLLYAMAAMKTWEDDVEMRERLSQILQTAKA